MITAKFVYSGDIITGFSVSGHSGSAEIGKDIICSAVSSASYMTVNTLTEIMLLNPEIIEKDSFLGIRLSKDEAAAANDLLKGFELHLKELSELYPNYIKIERGAE